MSTARTSILMPQPLNIIESVRGWMPPCLQWSGDPLLDQTDEIRILAITWNMKGRACPSDISDILQQEAPHHLYIISVQECLRSIAASLFYSSKLEWDEKVMNTLGRGYYQLASESLGGTSLLLVAHESIRHLISDTKVSTVTTGFLNLVPNKGGIGASFMLKDKSFLAISCHLASGESKLSQRNEDFNRIETEMNFDNEMMDTFSLASDRFDCVIWCGDLNYRIAGKVETVLGLIDARERWMLMKKDELLNHMRAGNTAVGFEEGEIGFPPTYKLKNNEFTKKRVPSWTDRILFKDRANCLRQQSYSSVINNCVSDHRPVFSQFAFH